MSIAPQLTTRKPSLAAVIALLLAVPLAGCVENLPTSGLNEPLAARSIEHALGTTEIDGAVERVVALEWAYVEALLAIGVQPVGVADKAGYDALVRTNPSLAASVVDVGTRQEPNLETIASLEPDLIIGVKFRHEGLYADLEKLAPTLVFDPWPANGTQLARMEESVLAIAEAVGRPGQAVEAIGDLHIAMEEGKARIAAAGLAGDSFVLTQVLAPAHGEFRLFQDHHTAVQIIEGLGLVNAWRDEFKLNGFSTVGLETMTTVEDAHLLYVPSSGASLERFAGNPAWDGLDFVMDGRVFNLSGAWLLPGPLSGVAFVDLVVEAMAPDAEVPRTVRHAMGETTLQGTPARIVALEWTYVEDLLAVGVQPIGVADVAGYRKWVSIDAQLADAVQDVGTRQEPSLEAIAALEPDLIIGVKFRHEPIHEDLGAIAPTLLFDPYPPEDAGITQYAEMEQTFMAIARAVNKAPEGRAVLDDLDARYAAAKAALAAANVTEGDVLLAQAFTWKDAPTMRVFSKNALASEVLVRVGLANAWTAGYQVYGFSTVGLEALEPVEHADFFYVAQANDNPFVTQWKDDPVWNDLAFVQEGRTYALGGDTWLFGGPLSAKVFVAKILAAYGAG